MRFSKSKWFAYTLLIGIIPMLTRLLVWATTTNGEIEPFASARLPERERAWKSLHMGLAILLIALYGALYTLALIGDNLEGVVDRANILASSLIIAGTSTLVGATVLHRLTKRGEK